MEPSPLPYAVWTSAVASSSMTAEASGQSWPRSSFFLSPPTTTRLCCSRTSRRASLMPKPDRSEGEIFRIASSATYTVWLNVFESASRYSRCSRICSGSASDTTKLKNQSYLAEVPAVGTPHQQLLRYSTSWRVFNTSYALFAS